MKDNQKIQARIEECLEERKGWLREIGLVEPSPGYRQYCRSIIYELNATIRTLKWVLEP